jgi:tRNA threonylcarbamoyladenosine biosynthesis protein TsaE
LDFFEVSETDYPKIAKDILEFSHKHLIWTFVGNLGAGKTTLIKSLAKAMNIDDKVQSPTFSLVNQYDQEIYHFDCYRLNSLNEALDFGMEEYLESDKYCWIEWPEKVESILPKPYIEIKIEYGKNQTRNISLQIKD